MRYPMRGRGRPRGLLLALLVLTLCACFAGTAQAGKGTQPKIVGGAAASIADWPYMVALRDRQGDAFCGGSLVNTDVVMTAAHCVIDDNGAPTDIAAAVLGRTDLTDASSGEVIPVAGGAVHPYYDPSGSSFDVAYLYLSAKSQRQAAKVESPGNNVFGIGDDVFSAGWGVTDTQTQATSENQLKDVAMKVQADEDCETALGSNFDANLMICAGAGPGYNTDDTCQGDSGGPLVRGGNDLGGTSPVDDVQIGVVSFGEGCAAGKPGAYSWLSSPSVAYFLANPDWDGSVPAPKPKPGPINVPAAPAVTPAPPSKANSASCKSAKSKLKKANKALKKAKKAFKKRKTTRNRKRVKKARKAVKKAKGSVKKRC